MVVFVQRLCRIWLLQQMNIIFELRDSAMPHFVYSIFPRSWENMDFFMQKANQLNKTLIENLIWIKSDAAVRSIVTRRLFVSLELSLIVIVCPSLITSLASWRTHKHTHRDIFKLNKLDCRSNIWDLNRFTEHRMLDSSNRIFSSPDFLSLWADENRSTWPWGTRVPECALCSKWWNLLLCVPTWIALASRPTVFECSDCSVACVDEGTNGNVCLSRIHHHHHHLSLAPKDVESN